MQKILYVLFWISYAMLVEASSLKSSLRHIFGLGLYSVDLVHFLCIYFSLSSHEEFSCNFSTVSEAPPRVSAYLSIFSLVICFNILISQIPSPIFLFWSKSLFISSQLQLKVLI